MRESYEVEKERKKLRKVIFHSFRERKRKKKKNLAKFSPYDNFQFHNN